MRIGIIGSGHIGGTLARLLAGGGHEVTVANSRAPETLSGLVDQLGERGRAGTPDEAAELDEGRTSSSELLARHLPGARVVKAFNTMYWERLRDQGRPAGGGERLAIPVAGDDAEAKLVVAGLIDGIGFDPVDTGGLADGGRRQQPGSPVYNAPLTGEQLRQRLGA